MLVFLVEEVCHLGIKNEAEFIQELRVIYYGQERGKEKRKKKKEKLSSAVKGQGWKK